MTKEEIVRQINETATRIHLERGIPCRAACQIATRAVLRAAGLPIHAGLGATTAPATSTGAPAILADISAAGDDPAVVAARGAVSKWSWLIPVGGLLMSAKNKISAWRSPVAAAMVGSGRHR